MLQYELEVSRKRDESPRIDAAILTLSMESDQAWSLSKRVTYFRVQSGTWNRWRMPSRGGNGGTFIDLLAPDGSRVAQLPEMPWRTKDQFKCQLYSEGAFAVVDNRCQVTVKKAVGDKSFQIRECGAFAIGTAVFQGGTTVFEIQDLTTQEKRTYSFDFAGFTNPTPVKLKLPKISPGIDSGGPWNVFQVPAWFGVEGFEGSANFHSVSLAAGSSISVCYLSFAPDPTGGYYVERLALNTGRSFALPSANIVSGSLTLSRAHIPTR